MTVPSGKAASIGAAAQCRRLVQGPPQRGQRPPQRAERVDRVGKQVRRERAPAERARRQQDAREQGPGLVAADQLRFAAVDADSWKAHQFDLQRH